MKKSKKKKLMFRATSGESLGGLSFLLVSHVKDTGPSLFPLLGHPTTSDRKYEQDGEDAHERASPS